MSRAIACPACHHTETKVVDTATAKHTNGCERLRECERCLQRFTTLEVITGVKYKFGGAKGAPNVADTTKLPAEPLVELLTYKLRGMTKTAVCQELEMGMGTLSQLVNGTRLSVHRNSAEKWANNMGLHPANIWTKEW